MESWLLERKVAHVISIGQHSVPLRENPPSHDLAMSADSCAEDSTRVAWHAGGTKGIQGGLGGAWGPVYGGMDSSGPVPAVHELSRWYLASSPAAMKHGHRVAPFVGAKFPKDGVDMILHR